MLSLNKNLCNGFIFFVNCICPLLLFIMCSLFRNKFRNESFRLNSHDYSSGGTYFITICTHMGLSYFGHISNGKMIWSKSAQIAYNLWYELPEHFAFVSLDEFVVMPNHVHGIIIIQSMSAVGTLHATSLQNTTSLQHPKNPVRIMHATSGHRNEFMSIISPKPGSLATVVRSYKSAVSKNIHLSDPDFSWQPRYYDHLIHSTRELDRIRDYIINNPGKWDDH
jgi:putative transposase